MGETKKILTNTAWMLFDRVFMMFLNLIVTVEIANHFGKSGYGSYQYAVSVIAILEILVTFVDGRVVKKRYLEYDGGSLVYNATICRVIFSVFSAVAGTAFIAVSGRDRVFSLMFSILLINSILANLRFGMANRFEYLLKSKKVVVAADIAAFVGAMLQLAAVRMDCTIIAISIIAVISSAINLLIVFVQYKVEFKDQRRGHLDRDLVWDMVKESLPLAVAASCATIYTRCDSVMIGNMLSDAEVGIYSISLKLIAVVQMAAIPIKESVYPKMISLYTSDKKAYVRQYIRITSFLTWLYLIGALASFAVLPFAFRFLDPEYAEAFPVYKIHIIGSFFIYNASLRAGHYTLINRGNILMYAQGISVVANIVMNLIGIHLWGMYGAAIATIITQGVSLFFSNLFFGKDGREVFWWQVKALNPMKMLG